MERVGAGEGNYALASQTLASFSARDEVRFVARLCSGRQLSSRGAPFPLSSSEDEVLSGLRVNAHDKRAHISPPTVQGLSGEQAGEGRL